jgi:hypothetical protein
MLMALVAGELLLLWVLASAASRGQGFWFFAAGLVLLAGALLAHRRGRRLVLYRLLYLSLLGAAAALAFEALLHAAPGLLRGHVANVAYTGYHWQSGGIYRLDPHRGPILRPSFRRRMYWNGHWWTHETNAGAYRGERLERADVVILGDSMIYGHGVEAAQTVPARFAALTGSATANLGQQGTSLVQSLLILLEKGAPLRPRLVLVSSHPTDVQEAVRDYGAAELEAFARSSPAGGWRPRVVPEYQPRPWWDPVQAWSTHLSLPLRSAGIAGALARAWRGGAPAAAGPARDPFVPTAGDREVPLSELGPPVGWQAHRHAVAEIKKACDAMGASLVLFDLGYPDAFSAAIESLAAEVGARYSPAGREALSRSLAGEHVYLADDGHWSPQGAQVVARRLALDLAGAR